MKVKKRQYRSKRGRPLKKSKAKSKAKKGSKRRVKKMRGGEYSFKDLDGDKFYIIKPGKDPEEYILYIDTKAIYAKKTSSKDFIIGKFLEGDKTFYGKYGTQVINDGFEFFNGIYIENDIMKYGNYPGESKTGQELIKDGKTPVLRTEYSGDVSTWHRTLESLWSDVLKIEEEFKAASYNPFITHATDFISRNSGKSPEEKDKSTSRYSRGKYTNFEALEAELETKKKEQVTKIKKIKQKLMAKCLEIYDNIQILAVH